MPGLPDVVALAEPRSAAAEAYRTLRTNIQFSSLEKPVRLLLLTSAGPDEGKSTTVANLAVVMAQADLKVVVVDCDLRRPSLHELFRLPNTKGLTSLFLGRASGLEAATEIEPPLQATSVPGLSVITSGPLPPNPAELLGSPRMDSVLAALLQRADVVLLDSPPVVAVTDAAVLSAKVDGVLLVVGAGIVKRDLARKARSLLEAVHANVLGMVVNNVPPDSDSFVPYGAAQPAERV
ncbi:MAG: Tyrosine-protein kinase EpsD [uncultured Chloroflexi bacterium]|uniref:non-specific protein-tyrosine kinase n=1 Tax=uncultured Chloroflexota bacterium TaxID=166587 RepID=A0A6J4K3D4_9CHLR|nr:MAG: Tyrosine-protein kinase EpsD [uncultured Chloroflexota bacterium]